MSSENVIIKMRQGADPATDRIITDHDGSRTTHVSSDPSTIVATAVQVADEGADRIELCGAQGPLWHAKVREAVGHRGASSAGVVGLDEQAADPAPLAGSAGR